IGTAGELLIGGPGVVRGYLGAPDLTSQKFVANPFAPATGPASRLYRTGDLVRLRPDGQIDFIGRLDHQVQIRGYRVELGEIESVINKHPGVRACAVVAREDPAGDQQIVGYVVPKIRAGHREVAEVTSDWKTIWDETYGTPSSGVFNTSGWIS